MTQAYWGTCSCESSWNLTCWHFKKNGRAAKWGNFPFSFLDSYHLNAMHGITYLLNSFKNNIPLHFFEMISEVVMTDDHLHLCFISIHVQKSLLSTLSYFISFLLKYLICDWWCVLEEILMWIFKLPIIMFPRMNSISACLDTYYIFKYFF